MRWTNLKATGTTAPGESNPRPLRSRRRRAPPTPPARGKRRTGNPSTGDRGSPSPNPPRERSRVRFPGAGRVLFFRLALPLPSYALRHVLASHGEVAELTTHTHKKKKETHTQHTHTHTRRAISFSRVAAGSFHLHRGGGQTSSENTHTQNAFNTRRVVRTSLKHRQNRYARPGSSPRARVRPPRAVAVILAVAGVVPSSCIARPSRRRPRRA